MVNGCVGTITTFQINVCNRFKWISKQLDNFYCNKETSGKFDTKQRYVIPSHFRFSYFFC